MTAVNPPPKIAIPVKDFKEVNGLSSLLTLALVVCVFVQLAIAPPKLDPPQKLQADVFSESRGLPLNPTQEALIFPALLRKEELRAGNPLATYAAMVDLESEYRRSKIFAGIYPEIRFNFEEFLGFPLAGVQAMSLPMYRTKATKPETSIPASFKPESALKVIAREAQKTRLVIYGEEHHLPQTRSLYEPLLRALWRQGYRYLAAETFEASVMSPSFSYPDYESGYYVLDPVFASAVRVAKDLGYKLVAYDTKERGSDGDVSFRDRTQAENIKARTFEIDPHAKVFVIAGRGHASEETAADGWTPMASVLRRLTGIDPLTLYAPRMSQRLTADEEDPLYRWATTRGLVKQPTMFVNRAGGRLLGSNSFDAYIFWPRITIEYGRPDWLRQTLNRKRVRVPRQLLGGSGLRLVQARRRGEPASAIPVDQVTIDDRNEPRVLMLPNGRFWLRSIDRDGRVIGTVQLDLSTQR